MPYLTPLPQDLSIPFKAKTRKSFRISDQQAKHALF